MMEVKKGYPEHAWIAIGHLAEAEDESLKDYPHLTDTIREHRLKYMAWIEGSGPEYHVPVMDLIQAFTDLDDVDDVIELPGDDDVENSSGASGDQPPGAP